MSDKALTRMAVAAVVVVAAIAAAVSYMHVYSMALAYGQPTMAAWLAPLSVDGMVAASSAALVAAARRGDQSPAVAKAALVLGVLATLAANAHSGSGHGIVGMLVGAWPAVAFILSTEVALGMVRRSARAEPAPAELPAVTTPSMSAIAKAAPARPQGARRVSQPRSASAKRRDKAAKLLAANPALTAADLARLLQVSRTTGAKYVNELTQDAA